MQNTMLPTYFPCAFASDIARYQAVCFVWINIHWSSWFKYHPNIFVNVV